MFINCQNTLGPGCRIIGWAHTEVGKDSGFRLVGQEEFIKNISTTIDGEEKRGKFREVYKKIFEEHVLGGRVVVEYALAVGSERVS